MALCRPVPPNIYYYYLVFTALVVLFYFSLFIFFCWCYIIELKFFVILQFIILLCFRKLEVAVFLHYSYVFRIWGKVLFTTICFFPRVSTCSNSTVIVVIVTPIMSCCRMYQKYISRNWKSRCACHFIAKLINWSFIRVPLSPRSDSPSVFNGTSAEVQPLAWYCCQ